MKQRIGKIERVNIRTVWKNEAYDFTPWLQENIDLVNDILDITLSSVESEKPAGNFSVDIVAEDDSGDPVIIENQYGKSDHDHLGKLLTYLTIIEAKTAIWIVEDARAEHISTISWLNESSTASFYLIKIEAVKIGESEPAPLLTLIVGPSEDTKQAGMVKKDIAERYTIRNRFWSKLLDYANKKTDLHSNISPGKYSWLGTSAGRRGLGFNYGIRKHDAQVELYIDRGTDSKEENEKIFDQIFSYKDEIESVFKGKLTWEKLDTKRACRISKEIDIGGYRDEDEWDNLINEMVNSMIKFANAFKPYIQKLSI